MPQAPGSKTGLDYSRIKQTLGTTGLQQENAQLFQVLSQLIDGTRIFQGFIEQQFPQLDGSLNTLFAFVTGIINELNFVRNNSKYSISLANVRAQLLPSQVATPVTFDTVIFDDGLMQSSESTITLNANGQYLINITCSFGQESIT